MAVCDVFRRNVRLPKLMEVSHRHAPMCQRAIGIFGYHLAKRFLRRRVCKRMQKRHSPLKLLLHVGGARRLKAHDAELLRDGMLVLVCGRGRWRIGQYEAKEANGQCEGRSYRKISNCRDSYHHACHRIDLVVNCEARIRAASGLSLMPKSSAR